MSESTIQVLVAWQSVKFALLDVVEREEGEGVISTAIAVLIMAALGAAMWLLFSGIMDSTGSEIESKIGEIGG